MKRLIAVAAITMGLLVPTLGATAPSNPPELTQRGLEDWLNSEPLTLAGLRGQVVLIEFWTYGCINCTRTLPWLKAMHSRYQNQGLVIIGVHTPEFPHERETANVRQAVVRHGIAYPVMLDADHAYWRAIGNRYWPAFYLVSRAGRIEATAIGELHLGTARGDGFEERIRELLGAR